MSGPTEFRKTLCFPRDAVYFQGHFDAAPIVAGVAQLDCAILPEIETLWPDLGPLKQVARVKFRRPIRPDEPVELVLTRKEDTVLFALKGPEENCSEGRLSFAGTSLERSSEHPTR